MADSGVYHSWQVVTLCPGLEKTVKPGAILPEGEGLRKAVRWLAEQDVKSLEVIEEASRRFDLSPLDEEFLIRHFHFPWDGDRP